ncbi:MAG: hypothetical protein WD397_16095 [Wenzhouxiangellaceae bacterium]
MSAKSVLTILLLSSVALLPALALQAAEPLGSSEQFKIDQVNRSLDNVDKDLERIDSSGNEGARVLALKGANRNLAQARDRFEQFVSRHPDLTSHSEVEGAKARLDRLAASIGNAEPSPSPAKAAAGLPNNGARSVAGAARQAVSGAPPTSTGQSTSSPSTSAGLSRKQQSELRQVHTTLNNAEKRLDAFREAERDDEAALALKGAKRGRDDAADRLETFVGDHPNAEGDAEVAVTRQRIKGLTVAIEQAESNAAAEAEVAASAGAEATADAERVIALRQEHDGAIRKIHGRSVVYSDSADAVSEAIAVIEDAENAADALRPFLLEFRGRYGTDEAEIAATLDAAGADADSANTRVAYNAAELYGFLEDLGNTRAVSAETVADNVAGRLSDIDDYSAKVQQQRLGEAAEMIRLGQDIDPKNPRLNALRGEIAQLAQAKREKQLASVDAAEWPGHVSNFPGPGDIEGLAEAVHEYLANDRDWGQSEKRPQEVLAVSVTGPWQVAAKDMFGQPIQWRLPVMVAITDDELKPDGIAQAFELSMVAKEGAPNQAPKSPPWDGFWVGDNYYLRMGALP